MDDRTTARRGSRDEQAGIASGDSSTGRAVHATRDVAGAGLGASAGSTGSQGGATALEWALLLGAIAIPSYFIITLALSVLVEHYRLMTFINSLPFP